MCNSTTIEDLKLDKSHRIARGSICMNIKLSLGGVHWSRWLIPI